MANTELFFDKFNNVPQTAEIVGKVENEVIPSSTMLLRFSIGATDFRKTVSSEDLIEGEGIDTSLLSTTTRLIDKTYVEKITKHDGHLKRRLNALGLRSVFASNGMVLLPNSLVGHAMRMIEVYEAERALLIDELIDNWDQAVLEVSQRNPTVFRESDYPSKDQIRKKFYINYRFFSVTVPDRLHDIDPKLHQKLVEEDRKLVEQDMQQIRAALRTGFADIVESMRDKLAGIGKERKTFKAGYVEQIRDFLTTFEAKNISGDQEMSEMVRKAKALLNGVTPDKLRDNLETKTIVEYGLKEIADSVGKWVEVKSRPVKL